MSSSDDSGSDESDGDGCGDKGGRGYRQLGGTGPLVEMGDGAAGRATLTLVWEWWGGMLWESGGGGCRRDFGTWPFSLILPLRWATGEVIGVSGGDAVPIFKLAANFRAALVLDVFLPIFLNALDLLFGEPKKEWLP